LPLFMKQDGLAISGLGAISAVGKDLAATLAGFEAVARNAHGPTLFQTPLTNPVFEAPLPSAPNRNRTLDLALQAAREAIRNARLESVLPSARVGVCLGTTVASQLNDFPFYEAYRAGAPLPMDALERYLKGNLADAVGLAVGARGPAVSVVNACSSGTDAIGVACQWLRSGLCDAVITGGADELNRVPFCGFHALGVMSPALCRPFDRDRQGLNLGEGAGILVLETQAHAARRGILPTLFVAGFSAACDAHHLTAPRPDGSSLELAIRGALAAAELKPEAVGFVNAHGTATRDNDLVEGTVLARVFGPSIPMLSTKGYTGHTLGAAGGLEAVFTAAALREGWIPPSAGFEHRDEAIPMAPVAVRTAISSAYALSTSLAFGGNNAAVLIGRSGPPGKELTPC
jgi:3-oxoacyl-[acyl-carrier-protein] synthase II